jgi:hypothetical protein
LDSESRVAFELKAQPRLDTQSQALTENHGWERGFRLRLDFSEPVDAAVARNALSIQPSMSVIMETKFDFLESMIFSFATAQEFGSRFVIKLAEGIPDAAGNLSDKTHSFSIVADGERSRPPLFSAVRMRQEVVNPASPLAIYKRGEDFVPFIIETPGPNYYDVEHETFLELYFECAPGAEIDINSVRDLFRLEVTNSAVRFSVRKITKTDFTVAEAAAGFEKHCRLEARGPISQSIKSGLVNFYMASGLKDTSGNKNNKAQQIITVK